MGDHYTGSRKDRSDVSVRFGCKRLAMGLFLGAVALAGNAQAATVTYTFTGEIDAISGSPPFSLGQTVMGTVTWADGLGTKSSSATQTVYNGMGMLSFSVAGFGPSGAIDELVIDDETPGFGDGIGLRSSAFLDSSEFLLRDPSGAAFSSGMIPLALDFADFSLAEFTLDLPGSGVISGSVGDLSLMQVPEPATAGLLALGLFGLAVGGRRS